MHGHTDSCSGPQGSDECAAANFHVARALDIVLNNEHGCKLPLRHPFFPFFTSAGRHVSCSLYPCAENGLYPASRNVCRHEVDGLLLRAHSLRYFGSSEQHCLPRRAQSQGRADPTEAMPPPLSCPFPYNARNCGSLGLPGPLLAARRLTVVAP